MAAYAAAVSLMHIIDLIKNHPSPPISLDRQQVDSLTETVTFFQEFLEVYVSPFSYCDEADPLEIRVAEAVYAAEDVIESYIVDNIHHGAGTTHHDDNEDEEENDDDDDDDVMESYAVDSIQLAAAAACYEDEQARYFNFYEGLQKVIEAMDLIKKEAMEKGGLGAELQRNVSTEAGSKPKSQMVGFDAELLQLKERLVGGDSNRQIIPIVGMGGIGKTTLARHVFADKLIKERFDIRLWATISQDYNIEQTLREVLSQSESQGRGSSGVAGLGEGLYKYLWGRSYLAVMDDMWSIEVWDEMRCFFPDCGERCRVIVTTRMANLAAHLTNSSNNSLCMSFLNEVDSWTLFSNTVFGSEGSDPILELQLRETGERIVGKCKGLPLSIVVIGGLLARSERTQGYWEYVEKNLNSIVNLENEEYCLRVLRLSYNHLPAYLKPCFLYMGVFDEDSKIEVSTIINLWISEGFVKPRKKKKLETVAREYLQELVDRNLVLAHELKSRRYWMRFHEFRSVGMYKMHDLVRDACLREAQKQRFYYVYNKEHNPPSSHRHRRIVIPKQHGREGAYGLHCIEKMLESLPPNPRSYVSHIYYAHPFPNFRLLRTLHIHSRAYTMYSEYSQEELLEFVNARLLAVGLEPYAEERLHSSISRLWSLHTLILFRANDIEGPVELWNMHQLKHVEMAQGRLRLPLPPNNETNNAVILENLHTLLGTVDFHLNEDVVRRMPNLTTFDVRYVQKLNQEVHSLSYLQRLSKLESFRCENRKESGENLQRICFPQSLKQIILIDNHMKHIPPQVEWEDVLQKIGLLPFVEELGVQGGVFRSRSWEIIEGQFPRLKTLQLISCSGLEKWTVSEGSHFPLLHNLILQGLKELEEIPSEIGEISTLSSIELIDCSKPAVVSAKRIVEEQEDLCGDERLPFRVRVEVEDKALESLASNNFQVKLWPYYS